MRIYVLSVLILLSALELFSQQTSRNNYTGAWEAPSSWDPTWGSPQTKDISSYITIKGFISCNSSLSFSNGINGLVIDDTLVIYGDLTLGNYSSLYVNNGGIIIIHGNIISGNVSQIVTNSNSYLIATGKFMKSGDVNLGSFYANNKPSSVFIGGSITAGLNQYLFPVFNCPGLNPYSDSHCSYGNMSDLSKDLIYPFFQSTGSRETPAITASGPLSFCSGNSVTLTSSEGVTYLWSTGATTRSIVVTATGNYTVRIKDSDGFLSRPSAPSVVNVIPLPPKPVITASGPVALCDGDDVTLSSSAGINYLWSTGETKQEINVSSAGNYSVKLINEYGCISVPSEKIMVTLNALPSAAANNNGPLCTGSALIINGLPDGVMQYSWEGPEGFKSSLQSPVVSAAATNKMAGIYTLSVTNASGCINKATTTVVVNELPVVNAGTDATITNGTSTSINANVTGSGPFIYSWSPAEKLVNAFIEDPSTVNLSSTTIFTLKATSTATSCSNSGTVTITISGGPLGLYPTASPDKICAGEEVQLRAVASGGSGSYTYMWTSIPSGFTSTIADPTVSPSVNTNYNVAVFDGFNTVNSQVSVIIYPVPALPTITADGPLTFCDGGSITLTSSPGGTYLWSNGASTQSIIVTESGSYAVSVTNADGCVSAPSSVTVVTVNSLPATPVITTDGPVTFCEGADVTLTSSAGSTYLWSDGAATQSVTVNKAGIYTVIVTDINGCKSEPSAGMVVKLKSLPEASAGNSGPVCEGTSLNLTGGPSGMATYYWTGPGGFTSSLQNPTVSNNSSLSMAGDYIIKIIDAEGCINKASTTVTINALPQVSIKSSNDPMCSGDVRTLAGIPAGGFYTVKSGPGIISGNILSAKGAGEIILEYIYTGLCPGKAVQSIIVDENVSADAGPDQDLVYVFETKMKAEPLNFGSGGWSLVSGSGNIIDLHSPTTSITGLVPGENKFLWKVNNGSCEASDEVVVVVNDIVTPTVITPNEDGLNDELIFPGLIAFPGSKLTIYNRWGSEVYRSSDYKNNWKGKDNKERELQIDTYYYILSISNGRIIKGFIEIRR